MLAEVAMTSSPRSRDALLPVIFGAAAALAWTVPAASQSDCVDYEEIVRWQDYERMAGTSARGIFVSDGLAAFAVGDSGVDIADVSDPSHVEILTHDTTTNAYGIAGRDRVLYVATLSGLRVVDISDPRSPVHLLDLLTTGVTAVEVAGDLLFAVTSDLHVFDIADPKAPVPLGSVALPSGNTSTESITCYANHVYIRRTYFEVYRLSVVDVTEPRTPVVRSTFPVQFITQVHAGGGLLLALGASMRVYGLHDPGNPQLLSTTPSGAWRGNLRNGLAYLMDNPCEFAVWDLHEPLAPVRVAAVGVPAEGTALGFDGDHAVAGGRDRSGSACLYTVALPPTFMPVLSTLELLGATAMAVGEYVYVSASGRFRAVDVSDRSHPAIVGETSTLDTAEAIALEEGVAYLALGSYGLGVVDLADPSAPVFVARILTGGNAVDVAAFGDRAIVASGSAGLTVFDLTEPLNPQLSGHWPFPTETIALWDDVAYAVYGNSVILLDVAGTGDPGLLGIASAMTGGIFDLDVLETTVMASLGYSGVLLIDATDPTQPVTGAVVALPGFPDGIDLGTSETVLACGRGGLQILDMERYPPTPAASVGFADVKQVASSQRLIFALASDTLCVLPRQCRSNPVSVQTPRMVEAVHLGRPEPNPSTGVIRFAVDVGEGAARVSVYDVAGRLVRALHEGPLPPGTHILEWDGADERRLRVPGGVYFVRLACPSGKFVRKVVVLPAR